MAHHTDNPSNSISSGGVPKEPSPWHGPKEPSPWPQTSARQSYIEGKEKARLEKKKKKLEEEIENIEQEIDMKKKELDDPANASDYVKLQDIQNEIDKLEEKLLELMTEWSE